MADNVSVQKIMIHGELAKDNFLEYMKDRGYRLLQIWDKTIVELDSFDPGYRVMNPRKTKVWWIYFGTHGEQWGSDYVDWQREKYREKYGYSNGGKCNE